MTQRALFDPGVPLEFIDRAFAVMAPSPQHVFLVLTNEVTRRLPAAQKGE
jgi:protein gp37